MKFFKMMMLVMAGILLSACSESDDHGHPHNADGGHSQEATAEEHGHEHGEDTHAHDAPETEAMYGDEADAPVTESEPHAHGEDTHTHEMEEEHHHGEGEEAEEHSHDDEPPHDH